VNRLSNDTANLVCEACHTRQLPAAARRYLEHAIHSRTSVASRVRLCVHGDIKLQNEWLPFGAEQVIRTDGEMLRSATVWQHGLPIRGFDRLVRLSVEHGNYSPAVREIPPLRRLLSLSRSAAGEAWQQIEPGRSVANGD
jgi:hypothetical protein